MKEQVHLEGKYLPPERLSELLRKTDEMIVVAEARKSVRPYRDAMIAVVACYLGLRRAELAGLRVCDVNVGRGESWLRVLGKGHKERKVVMGPHVRTRLVNYLRFRADRKELTAESPVFASQKGGRMSNSAVWRRWKKLVPDKPLHASRHSAAVMMFTATGNLRLVQRTLGHQSIVSTQIYADCLPSTMAAGVAQTEKLLGSIKRRPDALA
jgi:site-specific recombinase XerC